MKKIIAIHQGVVRMPEWRMAAPVDFELGTGEHIAIVGPNASGKSMLVDIITGAHPLVGQRVEYDFQTSATCPAEECSHLVSDNIKHITFRDTYGSDSDRKYYLQQRWNMMDEDDADTPSVGQMLDATYSRSRTDTQKRRALREHLYDIFSLRPLLDKPVICLSSGELRKFVLCRALMADPRVLIIDNPFIGLDTPTRWQVQKVMQTLSTERNLQLVLVLAKDDEIPQFITHVVPVRDKVVLPKVVRETYLLRQSEQPFTSAASFDTQQICREISELSSSVGNASEEVVRFNKVSIAYGDRCIFRDLSWTIRDGERWALSGQNGTGKSTLLSLICADNPRRYACDITLFGRKRGSGESIWDIKRHIGYVSPEMHRAYHHDIQVLRIVASGLKDSVGLHVKPTAAEYEKCRLWMRFMGVEGLAERSFLGLSSGEQRMVLLARAFVKDPSLLILDEPFHGLDAERSEHVKSIIDAFCHRPGKTLIMVSHYEADWPSCITHRLNLVRPDLSAQNLKKV